MSSPDYTIESLETIAKTNPIAFSEIIKSGVLPNVLLTFAAEMLGEDFPQELAIPLLCELLSHESSLVREGAIYGARPLLDQVPELRSILLRMKNTDPSPGVRQTASEII